MVGRVFEIREFCVHDGPGPRTTVFLQGCPLRCTWCHNPEGQETGGGREMDVDAVADEVLKTADFLVAGGGGVTFSGGEPLWQPDFVLALVARLSAREPWLTFAIETSGFAAAEDYRRVAGKMDVVYQDVKFPDLEGYRRWTGVEATPIFANIEWLKGSGIPFVVRMPMLPGVNDSEDSKRAVKELSAGGVGFRGIEYLPYNHLAGAKYARLGRVYAPGFDECKVGVAAVGETASTG